MLLCFLAALGLAQDSPDPGSGLDPVLLDLVDEIADEDPALARDLLHHFEEHGEGAVAERAASKAAALPRRLVDLRPAATVALWQGIAGASVIPLTVASLDESATSAGVVLAGTVVLGGGGVATALIYGRRHGLDRGSTTAIVGVSQLGALHGGVLAGLPGQYGRWAPLGVAVGGLGGLAGGYLLAGTDPDDRLMVSAYSGAWWGAGLGVAATAATYGFSDDADAVTLRLLAATDLGVVAFAGLADATDLSLRQIRLANVGGAFGAVVTYFFAWASRDDILWTEGALGAVMGASAVVGGVGGALVGGMGPPGPRHGTRTARLGIRGPQPTLVRTPSGPQPGIRLVSGHL